MSIDPHRPDLTIGVIGIGTMGRGIVQVAAEGGMTTLFADAQHEAAERAYAYAAEMIRARVGKGQIGAPEAEAAIDRMRPVSAGPQQDLSAFAACHVVIEAVAENLEVKQALLRDLEKVVSEDCVIATNTSSLSITRLAAAARRPERIAGLHFFNPVPVMRPVEVVGGLRTDPAVLDALHVLAERMGRVPLRVSDTPGFLVNHANRGVLMESLRIVSEAVCTFADVDRVLTEGVGFRIGPFALLDMIGLDVSHAVMESVYHQFYEEPRFRPVVMTAQRVAGGLLGRKSAGGFYPHRDGRAVMPAETPVPEADLRARPVWISQRHPDLAGELRAVVAAAGAPLEAGEHPSAEALVLITPLGEDATTAAVEEGLDAGRTLAVDVLFGLDGRRTLMTTPATRPELRDAAQALLAAGGRAVTVIRDSAGFIAQRVVASIVNVGAEIAQQRIARPEDINRAAVLTLGYPQGPLAFGDRLGPRRILAILEAMHRVTGEPRYRPSLWLRRRALLGLPLTTADL